MKGYAELEVFDRRELLLLSSAKRFVRHLPTRDRAGRWVRCHEVARVIGRLLDLQVADGHYGMCEHSWLWTAPFRPFEPPPNVLDCYVVGRLPAVQLVHSSCITPYEYRRGDARRDIRPAVMEQLFQSIKSRLK